MSYAILGQSCQTSMAVLVENTKFLPMNDPVYDIYYTRMLKYPATHEELSAIAPEIDRPEDIKIARHVSRQPEEYRSCCGKK